ncbi:site-specific integrase [Nonomuraea typhae]|uniref:site-specific integrase n=1 Tax=Nonomuraea typhae TaxID=2603600 RepID=UPI0012FCD246|nr:site-specific integrase [Nonomuraea typhae]
MRISIGDYEGSIYPENGRWTGAIDLDPKPDGTRNRLKRKGRTKSEVKQKLKEAIKEVERGAKTSETYTVTQCMRDFLDQGLNAESPETLRQYKSISKTYIERLIGGGSLKKLTADILHKWLTGLSATLSTRSLSLLLNLLRRAIRMAMRRGLAIQNVAELIDAPKGTTGRASKCLNLEQASILVKTSMNKKWRIGPYVILCLLTGLRTEEARALKWDDVDLTKGVVYVLRSDRASGDTKTKKSRRGFAIAKLGIRALSTHKKRQAAERLAAGDAWQDNNLVFCHEDGTAFTDTQIRYRFRQITTAAGLGKEWVPRELRHTFVSLLSNHGNVSIENIATLVGHSNTATTETVYRHELRPVIIDGAQAMDKIIKVGSA